MKKTLRQRIRFTIILISFMLFPVTIFYMSPAQSVMAAVKGVFNISLLVFTIQFVSSLFVGRLFCGWLCPGSGLASVCKSVNNDRINKKYNWVKYILWVPWVLIIFVFWIKSTNQHSINLFFGMQSSISILSEHGLIVYFIFTFVILIMSILIGRHSFCHHLCWMSPFMIIGRKISNQLNLPSLRIAVNSTQCNSCNACSTICPMSINVLKSISEKYYLEDSDCTQCGECIDVCKKKALYYNFSKIKK